MEAKIFKIPFEKGDLELRLPAGWEVLSELRPNPMPGLEDPASALGEALARPIGCEPLAGADVKGKKIVLAVDDITRPTPLHQYFGRILDHLRALGASLENMTVIPSLGIHVKMTQEEMERKLGKDNLAGLAWVNHDCRDMEQLRALGTTSRGTEVILNRRLAEADLIVCIGAVEPHALLGFGGGLKMILPGLAHERTIAQNHMQGVSPEKFNYIGSRESPMRLDIEEAAGMLGRRIFIINAVMNERLEICRFVCGDPVKAQREGADTARAISGREVAGKADVVILASNPLNADLRQGMKCIANVEPSVKRGGLILALLECSRGIGDVAVPPRALPHGLFRFILKVLGRRRILWFVDRVKKGAGVEERFMAHFSLQVIREKEIFVYSKKLPANTGKRMGLFRQFTDLESMMRAAGRFAPRRAAVIIYPYGGVTFPVTKG
jgi:nickel-dependent lactate racemase